MENGFVLQLENKNSLWYNLNMNQKLHIYVFGFEAVAR